MSRPFTVTFPASTAATPHAPGEKACAHHASAEAFDQAPQQGVRSISRLFAGAGQTCCQRSNMISEFGRIHDLEVDAFERDIHGDLIQ